MKHAALWEHAHETRTPSRSAREPLRARQPGQLSGSRYASAASSPSRGPWHGTSCRAGLAAQRRLKPCPSKEVRAEPKQAKANRLRAGDKRRCPAIGNPCPGPVAVLSDQRIGPAVRTSAQNNGLPAGDTAYHPPKKQKGREVIPALAFFWCRRGDSNSHPLARTRP